MNKEAIEMRYLLGKLSEAEAERLEERSFIDDSVFEEIEFAEDELIDAYVRGNLSAEDRKRFDSKVLNSERLAERVEFARLLSTSSLSVGHESAKSHWWDGLFNFSFIQNPVVRGAVVAGLFLIVVGLPVFTWIRLRDERRLNVERTAIEQQKQQLAQQLADQQAKTNQLTAELENSKAEEARLQQELQARKDELAKTNEQPAIPAEITLYSDSTRDPNQGEVLNVQPTASVIRLKLVLNSDDNALYRATITSPVGNILTKQGLKSRRSGQARIIILEFPARQLSSGEYFVIVTGRTSSGTYEPVAEYSVRVLKK